MNTAAFRFLLAAFLALFAAPFSRSEITFTNIADSTSLSSYSYSSFGAASINAGGRVVFFAYMDAGGSGIFSASGEETWAIALTSEPTFSSLGTCPSLNDTGIVVFHATLQSNGKQGIFTGVGGTANTVIADYWPNVNFVSYPSIDKYSNAAFFGPIQNTHDRGIYTGPGYGGDTRTIALTTDIFSVLDSRPFINGSSDVVFSATLDAGGSGIFVGAGGAPVAIAQTSGTDFLGFGEGPSMNDAGVVVFQAGTSADGNGIYTVSGGQTTTIAVSSGNYNGFRRPSINSAGKVAFKAFLDSGPAGIYVAEGSTHTRVVSVGDALFGSTVTVLDFGFGPRGLNDAGQIVFNYSLANGTEGIAVATVPAAATPAVRILSIDKLPGGTMRLQATGVPNVSHTIRASADLVESFTPIGTRIAAPDGTFEFDDTAAPNFAKRFYRVTRP